MSKTIRIYTDGACRGNPGPASIGVLFRQQDGPDLCVHSEAIGRATNNVAEYRAVLAALEMAGTYGASELEVRLDSELVVRQLTGVYKVRDGRLQEGRRGPGFTRPGSPEHPRRRFRRGL